MKKIITLLAVIFLSSFVFAQDEKINVSPIVQVVSYQDIYGKYVEMLGRGSASIINTGGVLITNNHVVTDEDGNEIKSFNICVTKNENTKPSCDYTATLMARDADMDIAMLKINPQDIYGNAVDYTNFKTISPDFDYVPQTQDEVLTIGYPWIGAETITQTKGIVSGIVEYNGYKYIKSDAIIEGGNSGGGMINDKTGKLIGVPTFTYGMGTTLSYALLISQAKDFIQKNIDKEVEPLSLKIDFANYKKTIENINLSGEVNDDSFDIKFSSDYEAWHYIPNKVLKIKNSTNKNKLINTFGLKIINVPDISDDNDFFYLLQFMNVYNKSYQTLVKQNIGGVDFYTPIFSTDKTAGETSSTRLYLGRLNKNNLIVMQIEANVGQDNLKDVNSQIETFLKGITFKKTNPIIFDFDTNNPDVHVSAGTGLSLADYEGSIVGFLGDLHEYFTIQIDSVDMYSGKGKSIKDLYSIETKDLKTNYKSMIKIKGNEGYLYCSDDSYSYGFDQDENGNSLSQSTCVAKLYPSSDADSNYYFEMAIKVDKKDKIEKLNQVIKFLQNDFEIISVGNGITEIPNVFQNDNGLKFTDLGIQASSYLDRLSLLAKYKLISNTQNFDPYKPLKWGEFLTMYFKMVYNFDISQNLGTCKTLKCLFEKYDVEIDEKQVSLYDVVKSLNIDINKYIDASDLSIFTEAINLRLAGVDSKDITREKIYQYANLYDEDMFSDWKNKVSQFEKKIYSGEKIDGSDVIGDTIGFLPTLETYYSPYKGIFTLPLYATGSIKFGYNLPLQNGFVECFDKSDALSQNACLKDFYQKSNSVVILTKYQAIDYIYSLMDFGLFDSELASQKDITIKDQSPAESDVQQ